MAFMARAKRRKFDEKSVAKELSKELGEKIDESDVSEEDHYGETVFKIDVGGIEYYIFKDDDSAEEAAKAYVKGMLESEPEVFNQDWLEGHIDMEALSKWVYDAMMEDDYAEDIAQSDPERFWDEAENWGIDVPEKVQTALDEGEDPGDVPSAAIENMREAIAKERSKDPMDWLNDIYSREEAVKKAMEVAGIDINGAAEEAVRTDGWAHFLSHYDGDYKETNSNFVYFRTKMMQGARSKKTQSSKQLKSRLLR